MSLKEYDIKRRQGTPEPPGKRGKRGGSLRFVIHKHDATRLHFDLRLEMGGVLKSWAVPRGPGFQPGEQRLAVFVEDHPLDYADFEGIIPAGHYGAGTVMIWDEGSYQERGGDDGEGEKRLLENLNRGHITFILDGQRVRGEYALVRTGEAGKNWLLVKKRDEFSSSRVQTLAETSARSGRNMAEIASDAAREGAVWYPPEREPGPPLRDRQRPFPVASTTVPVAETLPSVIDLMLPAAEQQAFTDPKWLCEAMVGGLRAGMIIGGRRSRLVSRGGLEYQKRFGALLDGARAMDYNAVLDGVICLMVDGRPDEKALRSWKAGATSEPGPVFVVYDLLHLDGAGLRRLSLNQRLSLLDGLDLPAGVQRPPEGNRSPEELRSGGISHMLYRHQDSTYEKGVCPAWLLVPVAETRPPAISEELPETDRHRLGLETIPVAELHQGGFDRYDGPARLTSLTKVYWPDEGYTKGDLLAYYYETADFVVPWLDGYPLSLNRHPDGIAGEGFYHKDQQGYVPPFMSTVPVSSEGSGKVINYMLCRSRDDLLYLANMGCIELHPWFSTPDKPDHPRWGVIDLDPDGNGFDDVIRVALAIHGLLQDLQVPHQVKTSGATGLHIGFPLNDRLYTYEQVREFCLGVCGRILRRFPDLCSLERSKAARRGKIYLDCFQNRRGSTLASPYCVRPLPGAPVSMPLHWEEVGRGLVPGLFTIRTVHKRLKSYGDLWEPLGTGQADLAGVMKKLAESPDSG